MERSSTISPTTGLNKGAWTPEEDAKLIDYVNQHGVPNRTWYQVPAKAGLSRCRKSCRFRWMNYLRPGIKRGDYTKEEDDLIIYLHKELGLGWAAIADRLPERTDCDIKNHWYTKLNKDPKPIKEKREQGGPGSSKRGRVDQNNTTPIILESSDNQYIGEKSTPVILETSALSLVSSRKSLQSSSTQNSEGSTSSPWLSLPTPNSNDKNTSSLKEVIVDLGIPSKNPDDLVDPSQFPNGMSSSLLEEYWDLPVEDVEMLVSPSILPHTIQNQPFCDVSSDTVEDIEKFNSFDNWLTPQSLMSEKSHEFSFSTSGITLGRKSTKFTSPVILDSSENQDIDENSQVTSQGSDAALVSPPLSSWIPRRKYSSAVSRTETSHHISAEVFYRFTSPYEFSKQKTSEFCSPQETSDFSSPEKFSCFTFLNSFVSLLQNSLNSLVSLCNFKKSN